MDSHFRNQPSEGPVAVRLELLQNLLGNGRSDPEAAYGAVRVEGPDAAEFLHRMCSQDVEGMGEGAAAPAAFLDPKGKLLAIVTVGRVAKETYVVETQGHQAAEVYGLLDRYHFTERLKLEELSGQCAHVLAFQGVPAASDEVSGAPGPWESAPWRVEILDGAVLFEGSRRGVAWRRAHGADPAAALGEQPQPLGAKEREAVRLLMGEPTVGVDTEPKTLGMEAGIEDFLSTTKGCYTGQEIVARIHTYGRVNRKLCLLHIEGEGDLALDADVLEPEDEIPVGRIKSSTVLPEVGRIAFAWLPADFWPLGTKLQVAGAEAQVWGFAPPDATAA